MLRPKGIRREIEALKAKMNASFGDYCPHKKEVDLIFEPDGTLRADGLKPCAICQKPRRVRSLAFLDDEPESFVDVPDEWEATYERALREGVKILGTDPEKV